MHQCNEPDCRNKCVHACVCCVFAFSQIDGHTGSVEEQPAKYSLCVTVRAKRSQTTSLLWPCLVIEGENKEWNYMFIFENNFNLLSPHFGKKQHPQGHSKPRWAVGRLPNVYSLDGCLKARARQLERSMQCKDLCAWTVLKNCKQKHIYFSLVV